MQIKENGDYIIASRSPEVFEQISSFTQHRLKQSNLYVMRALVNVSRCTLIKKGNYWCTIQCYAKVLLAIRLLLDHPGIKLYPERLPNCVFQEKQYPTQNRFYMYIQVSFPADEDACLLLLLKQECWMSQARQLHKKDSQWMRPLWIFHRMWGPYVVYSSEVGLVLVMKLWL